MNYTVDKRALLNGLIVVAFLCSIAIAFSKYSESETKSDDPWLSPSEYSNLPVDYIVEHSFQVRQDGFLRPLGSFTTPRPSDNDESTFFFWPFVIFICLVVVITCVGSISIENEVEPARSPSPRPPAPTPTAPPPRLPTPVPTAPSPWQYTEPPPSYKDSQKLAEYSVESELYLK